MSVDLPRTHYVSVMTRDGETKALLERWFVWIDEVEPDRRSLYGPLALPLLGSIPTGLARVEDGISAFGFVRSGKWEERPLGWVAWVSLDGPLLASSLIAELEYGLEASS